MRRLVFTVALLWIATLATSAQFFPRRVDPESDPNAFKITTQANLEEAMSRIVRLKAQLVETEDADEREFIVTSILELCQNELNEGRNERGVIVVERNPANAREAHLPIRWQGAFSAIEDEIRALGEEGMAAYQEQYGPRARVMLEQAMESRDRPRIADINRRFGLTRAGARAGIVLATMYWEESALSPAARMLERVLTANTQLDDDERAYLSAWLSHCYRDLGERASLANLIAETVALRERTVVIGGESMKLGDLLQQRLLETRDGTTDTIDELGVEWVGGNYANTGLHESPSDFSDTAWARTLPALEASRKFERFMNYPSPVVPPHLPVFDGTRVYINGGDSLLAYDLIESGTDATWECKPFPTYSHNWRTSEPDPGHIMPVSAYRGTVYAAVENPLSELFHNKNPDPMFRLYSHYPKVRRALCAVDGSTGRLLWKIGGQYEGDEHEQTNFLSSVVYQDTLYAIASRVRGLSEIFLYALDPQTGERKWHLRLCYGQQETTMFGRPAREPHPSLPAIAGGRLYLCTNIGGVVSVDLGSRSLRWISRYEYMPRPVTKYTETYYRDVTWFNSPTIYAEYAGKAYIVVAPTDADKMFAMDARTGKVLWDIEQDRQPLYGGRALVGVRGGNVYVAGDGGARGGNSSFLHTIDIENGHVSNSLRVTPKNRGNTLMLAGRPCLAANTLLWPGQEFAANACTIAQVDLDSMRVIESASNVPRSYARAGYSVFAQHGVAFTVSGKDYTLGNNQLAARFNQEALLEAARKEYESNSGDAEVAVRYGLLALRMGDSNEAVKVLKRAFEVAAATPVNTRVRDQAGRALVTTFLESADGALRARDYDEALNHVREARKFATVRSQLTECFTREERAVVARGDADTINAFYRDVIRDDPGFGVGEDPEIPAGTYGRIRLADRLGDSDTREAVRLWQEVLESPARYRFEGTSLRALGIAKLKGLIEKHGREVYAVQDAGARELVREGGGENLRRCIELYPLSLASDTANLELAWKLLQDGLPDDGIKVISAALEENQGRPRLAELQTLLALCYSSTGEALRARLLAMRILRAHPEGELKVGERVLGFRDVLEPLTEGSEEDMLSETPPKLPNDIELLWSRPWDLGGFTRLPDQPVAQSNPRFHIGERSRAGTSLIALDAKTGTPAWSQQVDVTITGVYRTGKGTLFRQAQGFALYDDDGTEIWASPSGGTPDPVSLRSGMLVYGTRYLNTRTRKNMVRITARDASTGGELWNTSTEANAVRWIEQVPSGILVLATGNESELLLLDPESGLEVARRTVNTQGRVMVSPVATDENVLVADRDGRVYAYSISDLRPAGTHDTKVNFPTMFELHEGDYVMVGLNSAARYSPADESAKWKLDFKSVTAQVKLDDMIVLGTRDPDSAGALAGFDLETGKAVFSYDIPRANESDRVDLQNAASFDGGIVAAFADNRIVDGRMRLWGFRLLVLNKDGSERFTWEHESGASMLFMQLALIDDHIALTCDSTTWCFGRGE